MIRSLTTASLLIAVLANPATAALVIGYDVNPTAIPDPDERLAVVGDPAIAGNVLTYASGLTLGGSTDTFQTSDWNDESNDYLSWGYTTNGASTSLDSIRLNTSSAGTGPDRVRLEIAINGDATSFLAPIVFDAQEVGLNDFSISSLMPTEQALLSNVTAASFRLYGLGGQNGSLDIEDGNFDGTSLDVFVAGTITAVPEPSSAVMLSLSLVSLACRRRKIGVR